jgi:NRPS condensation-like uncharacterized protein
LWTIFGGLFLCTVLNWAFDYLLYIFLGLETMNEVDAVFHPEGGDQKMPSTVSGVCECDKFEYDQMKETIMSAHRNSAIRMTGKLVSLAGRGYYKKLSDKEWDAIKDEIVMERNDIHNLEQVQDLISEECMKVWDANKPYWRVVLIPNYNDKESLIIYSFHHVLIDGVGLWNFMLGLSKNPDF